MQDQSLSNARGYRWLLWVAAFLAYAADQWSKTLIIQHLPLGSSWRPLAGTPILELFAFTHTKNPGAAFGIFPTGGWFFVVVAIVVSLGIVWYYPRLPRHQWWLFLSLGLQLGGALGNVTDRLRIGVVTDFIHVGTFPIFNIADSAIVVGVAILALHLWREDAHVKDANQEARDGEPSERPYRQHEVEG
jgi:signal peptidase II